jgi:hypothetical protein
VNDNVHDADKPWNRFRRYQASKHKGMIEAQIFDALFQTLSPGAVADEKEFDTGASVEQASGNVEKIVMALEFEEPGDFADDDILRGKVEMGTEGLVGWEVEEGVDGKAAVNFGVLLRGSDAGGEILGFHGIGHDDEMGSVSASGYFGGAEEKVGCGVLKGTKGRAMNGMNNDGDASPGGGEAAEDTGFATVGVDDIRAGGLEDGG